MADYYAVLELPKSASIEDIYENYQRLVFQYHPEFAGPSGALRYKEIQSAYKTLSDAHARILHDRYGLPVFRSLYLSLILLTVNVFYVFIVGILAVLVIVVLMIIFVALIGAYGDGHLLARSAIGHDDESQTYWNYKKVFSPIFAAIAILSFPLVAFFVLSIKKRRILWILFSIAMLSLTSVFIIVPLVKDHNDSVAANSTAFENGNSRYLLWCVCLSPLYLSAFLCTVVRAFSTFPTLKTLEKMIAYGLEGMWTYRKISFHIGVLQGVCGLAFSVFIALSADGFLTPNYFVVLLGPFLIFGTLLILDYMLYRCFYTKVKKIPMPYLYSILGSMPLILLVGLTLTSIGLISKRLNDETTGSDTVYPLTRALMPLYLILMVPFVFSQFIACKTLWFMKCGEDMVSPEENEPGDAVGTDANARRRQSSTIIEEMPPIQYPAP